MRFRPRELYRVNWRPRGPKRKEYDVTFRVQQTRPLNAAKARVALALLRGMPDRSHGETRQLEIEIVLARHRRETYRAMARRLGCSHVHCWRVAQRYRTGQIPWLPPDEESLLSMRESLGLSEELADSALTEATLANIRGAREIAARGVSFSPGPPLMTTDQAIAERWREARDEQRKNRGHSRPRVLFRVPVR